MFKNSVSVLLFFLGFNLLAQPGTQSQVYTINSYQTFQGYNETTPYLGKGQYQIFYDNINGVLDKPFIFVEGFDPEDSNTITTMYAAATYNAGANNLFDDLRNQGIDIIILNFPNYTRTEDNTLIRGGADYIERNGLVLVNLLQTINPQLPIGNDCIVMGVSMGGLVSRYGLRFMEQNALTHNTGLWFSFDSPHRGANVPIGLQYAINFIAEYNNDNNLRASRDLTLNSPAAKQMLLDHYTAHLQSGHAYNQNNSIQLPTPAATFRSTFENTINTMGFPTQTRKVAIANGSVNNTMVGSPGATVINTTQNSNGVDLQIKLRFTPAANISNYQVTYFGTFLLGFPVPIFEAKAASPSTSSGLDSAPGGTISFEDYVNASNNTTIQQIINALQVDKFSFIPTLSSLAVNNPNWYTSVNPTMVTNFDTYLGPTQNEPHVTLSQNSLNFILTQINNHYLSTNQLNIENDFVLLQNPSTEWIHFKFINEKVTPFQIQLFNVSGHLISNEFFTPTNDVQKIKAPSQSGVYLLKCNSDKGSFIKKLIVK